jgi:distribution and morphology protein 10
MKSVTTLILNPVMGHLSSSYTTHLRPSLRMTSRYDFNIFSYESDVSVGLEISQQSHIADSQEMLQALNARFSLTKVFVLEQMKQP